MEAVRVDRWLWSIRLFRTRGDATDACRGGHVRVNGAAAKAATVVRIGDRVTVRVHGDDREVEVATLIDKRVGAAIAATCFIDHTPPKPPVDRVRVAERERGAGRTTKHDGREMERWRSRE